MLISKNQNKRGFSLIEVLVSLLVLAGFISIVVQLSYGNTRRIKKARQLEKVANLLEYKMLELEESIKGENIFRFPPQDEGEFKNEENYFWSYETQPLVLPHPRMLLSLISLPENELNIKMAQTLASILSQSVLELKLTVRYEGKRGKAFHYSLVSYFVNHIDTPDLVAAQVRSFLSEVPAGLQ